MATDVIHKGIRICNFNKSDLGQWYWESQNKKNGNGYGNGIEIGLETRSVQNLVWERHIYPSGLSHI